MLIKSNRAALAETADDIAYIMGWEDVVPEVKKQRELFLQITDDQKLILDIIVKSNEISIDKIVIESAISYSKVAAALLALEFEGLIQSLPGKLYKAY